MNATPMPSNRHPVDQLANVIATIKTLEERKSELKEEIGQLMGAADSLGGDEFIAKQTLANRKGGLDEKKLAEKLGDLAAYRKPDTTYITLKVEPRALPEAA